MANELMKAHGGLAAADISSFPTLKYAESAVQAWVQRYNRQSNRADQVTNDTLPMPVRNLQPGTLVIEASTNKE